MKWAVAAPYFDESSDSWISDYVDPTSHSFSIVPRRGEDRNWHQGSKTTTGGGEWLARLRQANEALRSDADGIITVFPQLATAVGAVKRATRNRKPVVAWFFNTEAFARPLHAQVAGAAFRHIDRFVVHSRAEIEPYARAFKINPDQFTFVPLQYGGLVETESPAVDDERYVFATGSAGRDYNSLFRAAEKLNYPTYVLAADRCVEGLRIPHNVTLLDQRSRQEVRRLIKHATVNVVPFTDAMLTPGMVTIVETFGHGRSIVTTKRPGLDDYVEDGSNAICADLYSPDSLASAIQKMWTDDALRNSYDENARLFAEQRLTDEAVSAHLAAILNDVRDSQSA